MRLDQLFAKVASEQDARLTQSPDPVLARARAAMDEPRANPRRRRVGLALSFAALAGAAAATGLLLVPRALDYQIADEASSAPAGVALAAPADRALPLRFSDGSTVVLAPNASGTVQALARAGAEVVLREGRLDVHVQHADTTRWTFTAGPFAIRVTGTRFATEWNARTGKFSVTMAEGSVRIAGGPLTTPLDLVAGQRLAVDVDAGAVAIARVDERQPASATRVPSAETPRLGVAEPFAADERPAPLAPSPAPDVAALDARWRALAEEGQYRRAMSIVAQLGWKRLCREASADDLLTLGDVSRYARDEHRARSFYQCLLDRFGNTPQAGDAVFSLGRAAALPQAADEAVRWFDRYLALWPDGALAEQAAGRLVEALVADGQIARARTEARSYLARHPRGSYARLMERVLADGEAHSP